VSINKSKERVPQEVNSNKVGEKREEEEKEKGSVMVMSHTGS